jgi:hypothetical protein
MTWATDMAADAAELVSHFGRAVSYRSAVHSTFDSSTGARGIATVDSSLTMIRAAVSVELEFQGRSNRRIEMTRWSVTAAALSALSITPDVNDKIIDTDTPDKPWVIQKIDKKMDGAMYELACTRTA